MPGRGQAPACFPEPAGRRESDVEGMAPLARTLVIVGAVLLGLGLLLYAGPSLPGAGWLGRLPGDIRIERPGVRVYLPITSCLIVSAAVTALLWVVGKLR